MRSEESVAKLAVRRRSDWLPMRLEGSNRRRKRCNDRSVVSNVVRRNLRKWRQPQEIKRRRSSDSSAASNVKQLNWLKRNNVGRPDWKKRSNVELSSRQKKRG